MLPVCLLSTLTRHLGNKEEANDEAKTREQAQACA